MENILTKVDWSAFQHIFSGDTRGAFQRLAEQMFCFEFKQPYGIYRYYNQPYIETMPILYEDLCIGYQAKFFDAATNLANKKVELIAAISGAYEKYPGINKIVFYVNQEPAMSTTPGQEKPVYIGDIESHASNLGIAIEWRGLNQIETMLLHPEMQLIRDYFFHVDGGIRQFLSQIEQHKCDIFESIHAEIPYDGRMIKINRVPVDLDSFLLRIKTSLLSPEKAVAASPG